MTRRALRSALTGIGVVLALSAAAAPDQPAPASVEIVSAEFGIFDASDPQEMRFEATRVVPHQVGQRYGWIIEVRTTRRRLSVREEYLIAPSMRTRPADASSEVIDLPRRNQASQRQLVPVDGRIYGEWAIGPDEPAGRRHLQVVIEGEVAAGFEYDVK